MSKGERVCARGREGGRERGRERVCESDRVSEGVTSNDTFAASLTLSRHQAPRAERPRREQKEPWQLRATSLRRHPLANNRPPPSPPPRPAPPPHPAASARLPPASWPEERGSSAAVARGGVSYERGTPVSPPYAERATEAGNEARSSGRELRSREVARSPEFREYAERATAGGNEARSSGREVWGARDIARSPHEGTSRAVARSPECRENAVRGTSGADELARQLQRALRDNAQMREALEGVDDEKRAAAADARRAIARVQELSTVASAMRAQRAAEQQERRRAAVFPTPSTLHPKPRILGATSSTLHPTPETLNAGAFTGRCSRGRRATAGCARRWRTARRSWPRSLSPSFSLAVSHYLYLYLSMSIYLSIYLSVSISVCLSIYLSI